MHGLIHSCRRVSIRKKVDVSNIRFKLYNRTWVPSGRRTPRTILLSARQSAAGPLDRVGIGAAGSRAASQVSSASPLGPPANPGSATIAGYAAGLFGAFGVRAAVRHRDR